nr:isochorismatase family cysteine hydrolase [Delftia acidovorans]
MAGERGEIARLLAPDAEDLVILKPQHSAFHSTPLLHLLGRMNARRLVIVGFAADMCVMLTATDARMSGYEVWVPSDCTAAETPARRQQALRQLRQAFKCSVRTSARSPWAGRN